ncbi:MAG: nuclear transport factor 2 family protein [Jatrophihabitans sp.]
MDDCSVLAEQNDHFIEACRLGSWEMLRVILADDFAYLDGRTGETWDEERYIADLQTNPAPSLQIDELAIHVAGETATVSARSYSATRRGRGSRYVDTYARRDGEWLCVHACVWPLPADDKALTSVE